MEYRPQLNQGLKIVEKKRWMGDAYTQRLKGIPGLQLPTERPWAKNVYWMYSMVLDEKTDIPWETRDQHELS